jgi:error-prone DNA polymerase
MLPELHTCSAFSFLEGASLPEALVEQAAALDIPALALLDVDGVYGAPRFYMAAKKAGLKAHVGSRLTLETGQRLSLLCENRLGYQNLCQLVTRMKLGAAKGKGRACWADVEEFAAGLVCLTRQPTPELMHAFGRRNLYAYVQRHFDRAEEAVNKMLIESGLPLVATNGVSHATGAERELMDVLTCIREKRTLATAGRLLSKNAERHLKPERVMRRLFADIPGALDGARALSDRLEFTLADLGYEFPRYPVPDMDQFLHEQTMQGARHRYKTLEGRVLSQLEHELRIIAKLGLAGYFLIVWDLVQFCRRENILVQGRGSAANSAVCYSLGITAVDPVGMELLFERFLSEERGEWPDIDLDLPSGPQRERVIQYVYQRYGHHGAAMTANVITYRGKSAVGDVGKVLGFDEASLAKLSALMSHWHNDDQETGARFAQAGFDRNHAQVAQLARFVREIQDLPRHLGQHSGGMIVCQGSLNRVVPLEPATMPGRVVVQWDKDDCAHLGLIKVDLLGLGMMAVLEDTIAMIRQVHGDEVDLAQLPADDPAVYSALQKADTIGLFQVESRAQMSCLPRLCPKNFYDIVVQVAIIRPGPIVGNMVHPFLRRRRGEEPVDYIHPSLEPVLKRTLGVPLFQEQLIRMGMIAAGFSGGQAEELRRAFGFKRADKKMSEIEVSLRAGMAGNGIVGDVQDRIIKAISSFALYGFPESHAASFALLAYASAWLKCHYLDAFTACLLNNQPMGFYHPQTIVKDAQRHGLHFRSVDVARSQWLCSVEKENTSPTVLRLGFNYLRGFRQPAAEAIVARRPFRNIDDLARRVPEITKAEMHALADSGALNTLDAQHRRDALWRSSAAQRQVAPLLEAGISKDDTHPLAPMSALERLDADFRNSSFTIGAHPMRHFRPRLQSEGVITAAQTQAVRNGAVVRVAGSVIVRQQPMTAKGFVFLSMEDETGIVNIILTPKLFDRARATVVQEPYLVVDGTLQNQQGVVHVKAGRIRGLGPLAVEEGPLAAVGSKDFC